MHTTQSARRPWMSDTENLLRDWGEKTKHYSWLHNRSGIYFSNLNFSLNVPMIMFSTITASTNFAMIGNNSTDDEQIHFYIPIFLGISGVITTVLSSMNQLMNTSENASKHKEAFRGFNRLSRNICMELLLPPDQRKDPFEACMIYRSEFDRLMMESPDIPNFVIKEFNTVFSGARNKPEIASEFSKINVYGQRDQLKELENRFRAIRSFYKWAAERKRIQINTNCNRGSLDNRESLDFCEMPSPIRPVSITAAEI